MKSTILLLLVAKILFASCGSSSKPAWVTNKNALPKVNQGNFIQSYKGLGNSFEEARENAIIGKTGVVENLSSKYGKNCIVVSNRGIKCGNDFIATYWIHDEWISPNKQEVHLLIETTDHNKNITTNLDICGAGSKGSWLPIVHRGDRLVLSSLEFLSFASAGVSYFYVSKKMEKNAKEKRNLAEEWTNKPWTNQVDRENYAKIAKNYERQEKDYLRKRDFWVGVSIGSAVAAMTFYIVNALDVGGLQNYSVINVTPMVTPTASGSFSIGVQTSLNFFFFERITK